MNIIKKMILFIKNIFVKDKTIETIEKPTYTVKQENADDFAESLKVAPNSPNEKTNKKIETLTCNGDGLGIQKKISY